MIDSHCHLDHEPLLSDLKNVKDIFDNNINVSIDLENGRS